MKKIITILMAALMVCSLAGYASAGFTEGADVFVFEDFEYAPDAYVKGENFCYQYGDQGSAPTGTVDQRANYWIGNRRTNPDMESYAAIAEKTGVSGSSALSIASAITHAENSQSDVQMFIDHPVDLSAYKYLIVWCDFTKVEFRGASFSLITEDGIYGGTDERDNMFDSYWYLEDGTAEWQEFFFGGDNAFGIAQTAPVMEQKGYFAFALENFEARPAVYTTGASGYTGTMPLTNIVGVSFWWDHPNDEAGEYDKVPFYFDNILFTKDMNIANLPGVDASAASTASAGGEPTLLWDFNGDELMSDNMGANSNANVMYYGEEDYYTFMATGNDPYVSIDTPMDAVEDVWWAKIRVHNNSPATAVELFGATNGRSLSGPECTHFEIDSNSDEWKTYIIYIPDENVKTANAYKGAALEETYWEGNVDWIRLDPMWHEGDDGSDNGGSCESGDEIQIDYIAFFSNEADAKAYRAAQDTPVKYVAPAKPEPAVEEEPESAPNPIEEAAAAVSETASEAVEAVEEAASDAVEAVEEAASEAAEAVTDAVEEAKSGCGSVIGGGLIVLVTILGCGWMTSRRH